MKKFGKVCWWIVKAYFKLVTIFLAFMGCGTYFYCVSKTNINHIKEYSKALKLANDVMYKQFERALLGFKWALYCCEYKIKRWFSKKN